MQPPVNFRRTMPRCCIGCVHRIAKPITKEISIYEIFSSAMVCARDNSLSLEESPEFCICDGYEKAK